METVGAGEGRRQKQIPHAVQGYAGFGMTGGKGAEVGETSGGQRGMRGKSRQDTGGTGAGRSTRGKKDTKGPARRRRAVFFPGSFCFHTQEAGARSFRRCRVAIRRRVVSNDRSEMDCENGERTQLDHAISCRAEHHKVQGIAAAHCRDH